MEILHKHLQEDNLEIGEGLYETKGTIWDWDSEGYFEEMPAMEIDPRFFKKWFRKARGWEEWEWAQQGFGAVNFEYIQDEGIGDFLENRIPKYEAMLQDYVRTVPYAMPTAGNRRNHVEPPWWSHPILAEEGTITTEREEAELRRTQPFWAGKNAVKLRKYIDAMTEQSLVFDEVNINFTDGRMGDDEQMLPQGIEPAYWSEDDMLHSGSLDIDNTLRPDQDSSPTRAFHYNFPTDLELESIEEMRDTWDPEESLEDDWRPNATMPFYEKWQTSWWWRNYDGFDPYEQLDGVKVPGAGEGWGRQIIDLDEDAWSGLEVGLRKGGLRWNMSMNHATKTKPSELLLSYSYGFILDDEADYIFQVMREGDVTQLYMRSDQEMYYAKDYVSFCPEHWFWKYKWSLAGLGQQTFWIYRSAISSHNWKLLFSYLFAQQQRITLSFSERIMSRLFVGLEMESSFAQAATLWRAMLYWNMETHEDEDDHEDDAVDTHHVALNFSTANGMMDASVIYQKPIWENFMASVELGARYDPKAGFSTLFGVAWTYGFSLWADLATKWTTTGKICSILSWVPFSRRLNVGFCVNGDYWLGVYETGIRFNI